MTQEEETGIERLASTILGKAPPPGLIDQLKSAKREEVLTRLAALLDFSFKKGLAPSKKPMIQQRWFTIAGYIAQVMARLVRDFEYEKLRADVDKMMERFEATNVRTARRFRHKAKP